VPALDAPISLVIDEPNASPRELAIEDSVIKIGRLASAHVHLPYDAVARLHAVIEKHDGALSIIDLGASAGTLVNGVAVNKRELQDGDRITIGPCTLTVRVRR
jgi:pSer/pThr/pTyr-binding forkhead associated (FHA) protein